MGGVTFAMAGDFQHTPPITSGTRADRVRTCVTLFYPWNHVQVVFLSANTRVFIEDQEAFFK